MWGWAAGVPHVETVGEDGSPHGPKCFVLWNPPLTMPALAGGVAGNMSHTEGRVRARVNKWDPAFSSAAWSGSCPAAASQPCPV